jgi:hypothetical protein
MGEIFRSMKPETTQNLRRISLWLSIGLVLTILTAQLPSGKHVNFDGVTSSGEIEYFGRPFGWRLVTEEFRLGRGLLNYTKYNIAYFSLNLLVYTVLAIFIVDFFEKRRKHSYSRLNGEPRGGP